MQSAAPDCSRGCGSFLDLGLNGFQERVSQGRARDYQDDTGYSGIPTVARRENLAERTIFSMSTNLLRRPSRDSAGDL